MPYDTDRPMTKEGAIPIIRGRRKMKNRERQRANRRLKEELLDLKDSFGVNDPTPYEAVREIIQEFRKNRERGKRRNGLYKNVNRI
jgi:hypothetical protein